VSASSGGRIALIDLRKLLTPKRSSKGMRTSGGPTGRDGNGYPRPDTRWVFTPLGYVCGLNILPWVCYWAKIFTQWVNGY
jgi:hypothetical protein